MLFFTPVGAVRYFLPTTGDPMRLPELRKPTPDGRANIRNEPRFNSGIPEN
jgi:hypothetical protein